MSYEVTIQSVTMRRVKRLSVYNERLGHLERLALEPGVCIIEEAFHEMRY
jgi:hypothetical protein